MLVNNIKRFFILALIGSMNSSYLTAQPTESEVSIIDQIKKATEVFKDQKKAQAAGYRKFGPDMPNMGVHWINVGLAVTREVDFTRPSTLTYLTIDGKPQLTGVAYTYPLKPNEVPPQLPHESMNWHYHSGDLKEEAYGLHQHHMQGRNEDQTRLAMLHAWVWVENPEGYFVADNWALSYQRLGLNPPQELNPQSAKALFLVDGGIEYFSEFISLSLKKNENNKEEVESILIQQAKKVNKKVLKLKENQGYVSNESQEELKLIWIEMWKEIEHVVGDKDWPLIEQYLDVQEHHH